MPRLRELSRPISLRAPAEAERPTALALGSFDGLHPGHRRVIAAGPSAEVLTAEVLTETFQRHLLTIPDAASAITAITDQQGAR